MSESIQTPTSMLPFRRKPTPPNIFYSSMFFINAKASRMTAARVLSKANIALNGSESVRFSGFKASIRLLVRYPWAESVQHEVAQEDGLISSTDKAQVFGLWCLNACRIVSAIEDTGDTSLYGFVYGTLPGHVECGEERFQVRWNRSDDGVWHDILAFSRPNYFLARVGYPIVRKLQKRFARDSAAAM